MSVRNIRRQVLVPLTLTFVVLIGVFLYSGYHIRQTEAASVESDRFQGVHSLFHTMIRQRLQCMATVTEHISGNRELAGVLQGGDRDQVLAAAAPVFGRYLQSHGLQYVYIHSPAGEPFLCVHNPSIFPYSMERFSTRQAVATGEPVRGMELSPLGTLNLWYVLPWRVDDKLIGYLEVGQDVERILGELKTITQVDFLLLIKKSLISRELWELGMRRLERDADWDLLPDHVIINHTSGEMVPWVIGAFRQSIRFGSLLKGERIFDDRYYHLQTFPLEDTGRKNIGEFILIQDRTGKVSEFRSFLFKITALSLALCSALFAFAYSTLGRVDWQLDSTRRRLLDEFGKTTLINTKLEKEIAERRRAEEDLRRLNENLEQRVLERTRSLERMNKEIVAGRRKLEQAYQDLKDKQAAILHQDKMACIGQLAAGVAHDINNPIGFVASNLNELSEYLPRLRRFLDLQWEALQTTGDKGLLQQMEKRRQELQLDYVLEDLDPLVRESLEGAERISKIVRNLSNFSRADEVEYELADIHDCLESTISITANELRYKAAVHREYGSIPLTRCYPQQLNQVFMNLLINAAHAIEERGEVTIRTWAENGSIFIAIADTGCGIPKKNLKKIFEPFFTTKEVGKGTGLGLSITYEIIQKHGGEIRVESEPGQGTTFTIRLPVVE